MFLFCSIEVKAVGPAAVSFSTAPIWGRLTGLIDRPLEVWTGSPAADAMTLGRGSHSRIRQRWN
jgi:hypothetical protein